MENKITFSSSVFRFLNLHQKIYKFVEIYQHESNFDDTSCNVQSKTFLCNFHNEIECIRACPLLTNFKDKIKISKLVTWKP